MFVVVDITISFIRSLEHSIELKIFKKNFVEFIIFETLSMNLFLMLGFKYQLLI